MIRILLIVAFTLAASGCGQSTTESVNPDYALLENVQEQAELFELQTLRGQSELGFVELGMAPDEWRDFKGYLRPVPSRLKSELDSLYRALSRAHPELHGLVSLYLAEHAQLVPESQAQSVTEDMLGYYVLGGAWDGQTSWAAVLVVNLDTFTLAGYSLNPTLRGESALQSSAPFVPAQAWVEGFSYRRLIADDVYERLTSELEAQSAGSLAELDPSTLAVLGVAENGAFMLESTFDLARCEACAFYLPDCPEK